ncbi:MAG TPA: hypothetical protein VMM92_00585, partial [Thermoanaerobaculia bacterium]|nr:hypothetical protein [Thermoanaerobaculia bacterium]
MRTLAPERARSVAFSPDGKLLAVATSEETSLWEVASGKLVRVLSTGNAGTTSVAFSPQGSVLATADKAGRIEVWDANTGETLRRLEAHTGVNAVAFSSDGKTLAAGNDDSTVAEWDWTEGKLLKTLTGHTLPVRSVAFPHFSQRGYPPQSGDILASGSDDGRLILWNTGSAAHIFRASSKPVLSVGFWGKGTDVATGSADETIRLWDGTALKAIRLFEAPTEQVRDLAFAPDGKTLAVAGGTGVVHLWDPTTGKLVGSIPANTSVLAYSPTGLLAMGSSGAVSLWDAATRKLEHTFESGEKGDKPVDALRFSPSGEYLAALWFDRTATVWDTFTDTPLKTLKKAQQPIMDLAFSPDRETVASLEGFPGTLVLREVASGRVTGTFKLPWANHLTFSPDAASIVASGSGAMVQVLEAKSGRLQRVLTRPSLPIESPPTVQKMVFSPDSSRLAALWFDGVITLWEMPTGRLFATSMAHTPNQSTTLAASPDGSLLVSIASDDTSFRYWSFINGEPLATSHALWKADFITYTPEGFYVASPGAEARATWKVSGEEYGTEQYSARFRSPDRVTERLANRATTAKGEQATAEPPSLRWVHPFATTNDRQVKLVVAYEGAAELDDLIVIFNGLPIHIERPSAAAKADIEIPLSLVARSNHLVAYAFDRRRVKSPPLEIQFEYLEGAATAGIEVAFADSIPTEIVDARVVSVNGQSLDVGKVTGEARTIALLGGGEEPLLRRGVNWLQAQGKQLSFWWEDRKLKELPTPYKQSFAILAAIDDYDRKDDPKHRGR